MVEEAGRPRTRRSLSPREADRPESVNIILASAKDCSQDLVALILGFLTTGRDLARSGCVCKMWNSAAVLESLWKAVSQKEWPLIGSLAKVLGRGISFRHIYRQRMMVTSGSHLRVTVSANHSFCVQISQGTNVVYSKVLSCMHTVDTSSDMVLEDEMLDEGSSIHESWEEWCDPQNSSDSEEPSLHHSQNFTVSIQVLRHSDGSFASLGQTKAGTDCEPTASEWNSFGGEPFRRLRFGGFGGLFPCCPKNLWEPTSLLQSHSPLPSTRYVVVPVVGMDFRPSQGWLDATQGLGSAQLFNVSVKFEAMSVVAFSKNVDGGSPSPCAPRTPIDGDGSSFGYDDDCPTVVELSLSDFARELESLSAWVA